jgi:amino acid adenylation domain-containing protein
MQEPIEGFRLSPQQDRLWDLQAAAPGCAFHAACTVTIDGPIDPRRLAAALAAAAERHEILRTRFPRLPLIDRPVQVIDGAARVPLALADLAGLARADQERGLAALFDELAAAPFDLAGAPLLRSALVRLGAERWTLLLALPALCADAASLRILAAEVAGLYGGGAAAVAPAADLPQYADVGEWFHELLASQQSAARRLWQELDLGSALARETEATPPSPPAGFAPRRLAVAGGAELRRDVEALAGDTHSTQTAVLFAAWTALLGRFAGSTTRVVGTAYDGRRYAEMAAALGPCARFLPVVVEIAPEAPFATLVARVEAAMARLHKWQELFAWEMAGGGGRTPQEAFFPHAFEVQTLPAWGPFALTRCFADIDRFAVKLVCTLAGDRLELALHFDRGAVAEEAVRQMAAALRTLLADALAHPATPVGDLALLPAAAERRLDELARGAAVPRPPSTLAELCAAQARRTPPAVAVSFRDRSLTYAELDRRAGRLARRLRALGVGPDVRVALLLERSFEMVVAMLAVVQAGGAWLPLDPDHPAERLRFTIADAAARVLLTREALLAPRREVAGETVAVLTLDDGESGAGAESDAGAGSGAPAAAPDDLAYVIYTSGSTGHPKGVMVSHRAISNRLLWMVDTFAPSAADRVLQKTPYTFDASVWEIFLPLVTGAQLVLAEPGGHQEQTYLAQVVASAGITVVQFVPSLLSVLLDQAAVAPSGGRQRLVFCGGEALPRELALRCHERLSTALYNTYGPTEAAIDVACHPCDPDAARDAPPIMPIGRPLPNLDLRLLDPRQQLVPAGRPGELAIGGPSLARGYLGRPDLTAERFIPHPWPARPGERLYRTGDLARLHERGVFEFLGRIDQQVKVRGLRIELGEIEAALVRHPAVREAAVMVREEAPGHQDLVAYLAVSGPQPPVAELRDHLARQLPDYMLPSRWVVLPTLPRTAGGKLDRRALPAPDPARPGLATEFVAPRTRTEQALAAIWCELLAIDRVGIHDNFFHLGGHSLIAVRVGFRVRQVFDVGLKVRTLFEAGTIAQLAREVEGAMRGAGSPRRPPLGRAPRPAGAGLPLSFPQQRLWFLQQLEPQSPAYNVPGALTLAGPLSVAALAGAVSAVVARHETLRTTFQAVAGDPVQVVGPVAPVPLPCVDLAALDAARRESETARLAAQTGRRVFDLARGPLLRLALLRHGADRHVLLFNLHHIVSDAWSVGVLVRELSRFYAAARDRRTAALPVLPVQYADYACWQRGWLRGEALAAELAFWRERLAGAPEGLDLPLDHPRPASPTYRGTVLTRPLPQATAAGLRRLSHDSAATLYMTLLAAFKVLLHRYGAGPDIVVGTNVANREPEVEGLIGFFANALALRTHLDGNLDFRAALARVRETVLTSFAHQELPFDRLVEELKPPRNLAVSPIYQVVFELEVAATSAGLDLVGLEVAPLALASPTAKFELTLTARDLGLDLLLAAEISTEVFEEGTAAALLDHLAALAASIVADPDRPVADLALLSPAETAQLLDGLQGEVRRYPIERTLGELCARQAARTPAAVAAVCGAVRLTYRDLDRAAARLALPLHRAGFGPGHFVGILAERGLDFLAAQLAIFEAGCAYLPIDPTYPDERVRFMIAESGISALFVPAAQRARADALTAGGAGLDLIVALDLEAGAAEPAPRAMPPAAAPQDPAYMLFTSGSTGVPKGVVIRHDGAVNHIFAQAEALALDASLRFLQSAPSSSDISVWQLLAPLVLGGRTVIVDAETVADPARLLAALRQEGITLAELVPAVLRALVEHAAALSPAARALPDLRFMMATGETVPVDLVNAWLALYPAIPVVNAYGPTEASDDVTQLVLTAPVPPGTRSLPIGRPLANVTCYVLDRDGRPAPVRIPGELAIGGIGVGLGYWRNPARTAESFVPNPFARTPGDRLYRTGDLVRWLPDGNLEFLGRFDHQVKIRGFRIELAEIEAALAVHPHVRESAVLVHPGRDAGRLVAYLVVDAGWRPTTAELRAFLEARLPAPLVPALYVALDAMPRTANGKIDRRRLPAAADAAPPAVAPRTPSEATVARIWAEVLERDEVGVESDFFELGGHSLLAIKVISRLAAAFGVELPLRSLFLHPTVTQLAQAVERGQREARRAQPPTIRRVARIVEREPAAAGAFATGEGT